MAIVSNITAAVQKTEQLLQEERQASSRLQSGMQQLEAEGTASSAQLKERDETIASLLADKQKLEHTIRQLESGVFRSVNTESV